MDLSTLDARRALAGKWGTVHKLDPLIVCAVCEQESSWVPWAVRFEPGFLHSYVKPVNPAAPTTGEICRAMSFGLMQIMGLTAFEFGWRGSFFTDLCDPDTGVDYGCRKLAKCFEDAGGQPEAALLRYNGGWNQDYGRQVLARVAHYQQ